jgi:hypothetical protein
MNDCRGSSFEMIVAPSGAVELPLMDAPAAQTFGRLKQARSTERPARRGRLGASRRAGKGLPSGTRASVFAQFILFAGLVLPFAVHAGHYEISIGKREPMCRDLRKLLNSDAMPPTPTPLCMWRFEPMLPDARFPQFALPKWESVEPAAHWEQIRSWHMEYHRPEQMPGLPQGEAERRWTTKADPFFRQLNARGALILRRTKLGIDPVVPAEQRTVYGLWLSECTSPGHADSNSPTMIVPRRDEPHEAEPMFATYQLSAVAPFYYYGQLWFSSWSGPDGADEVSRLGADGESAKLTIKKPYRRNADSKHFGVVGRDCEFNYFSEN